MIPTYLGHSLFQINIQESLISQNQIDIYCISLNKLNHKKMKQFTTSVKAFIAIAIFTLAATAGNSQNLQAYYIDGNNALPIQKLSATAVNNTIAITWQANTQLLTATDMELERSTDMTDFKTICYVMTPEASEFASTACGFKDKQAAQLTQKSNVYYRLKLTDKAGNVSYSELVTVRLK
jgi:hypothetical protein